MWFVTTVAALLGIHREELPPPSRVTRDSDLPVEEDPSGGSPETVEESLRDRRRRYGVRLQFEQGLSLPTCWTCSSRRWN